MTALNAKVDGHAHIRIYSEDEQPDLIAAIAACTTHAELSRLTYINLGLYRKWDAVAERAIAKQNELMSGLYLGLATDAHRSAAMGTAPVEMNRPYPTEEIPTLRTIDEGEDGMTAWARTVKNDPSELMGNVDEMLEFAGVGIQRRAKSLQHATA